MNAATIDRSTLVPAVALTALAMGFALTTWLVILVIVALIALLTVSPAVAPPPPADDDDAPGDPP